MVKVKPSNLVLIVLLLASVAFLAYTLNTARQAQPRPPRASQRAAASAPKARSRALAPAAPANADFSRYQLIVTRDVFSSPKPSAPTGPARPGALPPLTTTVVTPTSQPSRSLSFPGWSYVGCIVINGKMRGVLQNAQTRSGMDVIVGDSFQGATVEQITPDEIRLRAGLAAVSLYLPTDFPVLPLENPAAPPAPAGPRPGQPSPPPLVGQPG
jgi:hypothetical protein